jgi:hypothetical protein
MATRNRFRFHTLVSSCALALTLIGAGTAGAQQAATPAHVRIRTSPFDAMVSVDVKRTSLLTVLDLLMKQADANYTLDSHLQDASIGAVRLKNVPLLTAMSAVLRASNSPATYRIENSIIAIVSKSEEPVAAGVTESNGDRLSVEMDHASLHQALKEIFASAHADFSLEQSVTDTPVTIHVHDQPFRVVLDTILRAAATPLSYRVENGVYTITKPSAGGQ